MEIIFDADGFGFMPQHCERTLMPDVWGVRVRVRACNDTLPILAVNIILCGYKKGHGTMEGLPTQFDEHDKNY